MNKTRQETLKSLEEIAGELISSINLNRLSVGEVMVKYRYSLKNYVDNYNLTDSQAREITEIFCHKLDEDGLVKFSKRIQDKINATYKE
ncbi:MAG: hypothetical protein AABW51_04455 [Nanoarchaeota archaeon]